MLAPTKVLLVDDHAVLRAGLRALLLQHPGFDVVGEAENALEALNQIEKINPDLVLLDLSMPGLSGLDTISTLRKASPHVRILILTMHDDAQYLRQALQRGAVGYVLKKAADEDLLAAMRAVMNGEIYVHTSMTKVLLEDLLPNAGENEAGDIWKTLSDREQDVLTRVALGHTSAEIAEQLNLSAKTVETYRARGMEKLGLLTRAALVRFALQRGLLSADGH